ncbi:MAG: deoxyribose-phosphate aldolase [Eubacteriales bacterium]|nr:deoxyribose-phosphate aldolase [Eubacteriales bacterium]
MDAKKALSHVDHTLLKATSTWEQVKTLCEEAVKYNTASVCIPPSFVKKAFENYGDKITICTVIGFPLGYNTTAIKKAEVEDAIKNGATEVDMVVNLGDVKEGNFDKVEQEIKVLREASGKHILKVIVETCYLTEEEKIKLCECVTNAKADYIKTSTGFGTGGATLEDIELFKKHIGKDVKIKASGGIRTREDIEAFLAAGADRIGASSAVKAYME